MRKTKGKMEPSIFFEYENKKIAIVTEHFPGKLTYSHVQSFCSFLARENRKGKSYLGFIFYDELEEDAIEEINRYNKKYPNQIKLIPKKLLTGYKE